MTPPADPRADAGAEPEPEGQDLVEAEGLVIRIVNSTSISWEPVDALRALRDG